MAGKSTSIPAHLRSTVKTVAAEERAIAAAQEVSVADGKPSQRIKVLPFGDPFFGRDGRGPWILRDRAHAEQVLAATRRFLGGADMMVDYDHQSELAATAGVGGQAPAAGWVRNLQIEGDGIWADVEWTPKAEAALASREYRYVSPNFRVHPSTREVIRLVNAGLTNSPNLELPALAHQQGGAPAGEDPDMSKITLALASLATALAIPAEGLDESKVLAAIDQLKSGKEGAETALASIRSELQLGDDASAETVLASVKSARTAGAPDPTKYVPKAGYDDLTARLAKLEEDKVLASVDQAVKDGKLAPAMKEWAIDLGKKDPAELEKYLGKAVPVLASVDLGGQPPKTEKGKLSDEEKAICAATGIAEADFLKTRDEEAA